MQTKSIPAALLAGFVAAALPRAQETGAFQVRAAQLILGDGSRLEDAVMLVEGGKITKVGRGVELNPALAVVDHAGVLAPGWVALSTQSGVRAEAEDLTRSLLPEARLVHALDRDHGDLARALEAGITTLLLTPSSRSVAGGVTAVVKSAGGEVLEPEAHLALSLSGVALGVGNAGSFFIFGAADVHVSGGPEETGFSQRGTREPTSYSGAMYALRALLRDGEGVFARVRAGELPVLIEAWDRNEVARAIELARSNALSGAIRGAPLAGDLAGELRESGLGVVLGPFEDGQSRRSLESLRKLGDAGVPLAFALGAPWHHPERLRLSAALAIAAGADPVVVWKALTSDAARIAGVAERVGALERGKDADFVLWSGDPLDLGSRIEAVFVDGERVHARPTQLPELPELHRPHGSSAARARGSKR